MLGGNSVGFGFYSSCRDSQIAGMGREMINTSADVIGTALAVTAKVIAGAIFGCVALTGGAIVGAAVVTVALAAIAAAVVILALKILAAAALIIILAPIALVGVAAYTLKEACQCACTM